MSRRRVAGAAAVLLAAVGIGLLAAEPASAMVTGPCTAELNGINIDDLTPTQGDAIIVGQHDSVPMTMTSSNGTGFSNLHIYLSFVVFNWSVYDAPASGGTWSHDIDVNSFAKYGVGLYELWGTGDFVGGGDCTGTVLVRVTGNPLGTPAGIAAAASTGVGVLSVFGAGMAAGGGGGGSGPGGSYTQDDATKDERREQEEQQERETQEAAGTLAAADQAASGTSHGWCFLFALALLPLLLLFGSGAALMGVAAAPAVKVSRRSWPFALGAFGGLLTGLGAGVLLQEYAILYPTRTWGIVYLAGGIAFGLAVPIVRRLLSR